MLKEALNQGTGTRAEARNTDGFAGLKSLLPPPSRRGCVLIDPSYELEDDYPKVAASLSDAVERFATGTYLIWYPLLRRTDKGERLRDTLLAAFNRRNRCVLELRTAEQGAFSGTARGGLYGSGLVIYNPPWQLKAAAAESLPFLSRVLGGGGGWQMQWA